MSSKTLLKIFKENDEGKLVLPDFQRGFEWKVNEQKKLLSTVLSLLPIGSILLLEGERGEFATRQLCYRNSDFEENEECLYLLDGQQRTSTLRALFSNLFGSKSEWEINYDNLYKGLRYRWFIDVRKMGGEDIFGYEKLSFKKIKDYEPDQLLEAIVEKKITKQNQREWFHPAYEGEVGENIEGNRLKLAVAKKASEEGLIPLYDIYDSIPNPQRSLFYSTLEKLASNRLNELKASVLDDEYSIVELLEPVSSDIQQHIEDGSEEEINNAWATLASDWKKDMNNYLIDLLKQDMHVIQLPSDEIGRATAIYESINKGGLSLNAYDLLVAKAARVEFGTSLTTRIIEMLESTIDLPDALLDGLKGNPNKKWSSLYMGTVEDNKLSSPIRDQFLNMLSIFSHEEYGEILNLRIELTKKEKQLSVSPDSINENLEETVKSIIRACAFLQFRCGKISIKNLNYKLMLLPIAYLLKDDEVWNSKKNIAKIEYWYWTSLFGGSYRERPNQKCIEDIIELYKWIKEEGYSNPFEGRHEKVLKNEGYSTLNVLLNKDSENKVPAAIQSGILEYVLSTQPIDFIPEIPGEGLLLCAWNVGAKKQIEYPNNVKRIAKIEDHHIYPLGADFSIGNSSRSIRAEKKHILNSPLNRTYISDYANGLIRDKAPDVYFEYIPELTMWSHSVDNVDWRLRGEENAERRHERLLTNRYNKLLENINIELSNLLHTR